MVTLYAAVAAEDAIARAPFLARRHPKRQAIEVSTLNARETTPSEVRFWAAPTLDDLIGVLASELKKSTSPAAPTLIADTDVLVKSIRAGRFGEYADLFARATGRPIKIKTHKDDGSNTVSKARDQFKTSLADLNATLELRRKQDLLYDEDGSELQEVTLLRSLIDIHRRASVLIDATNAADAERRAVSEGPRRPVR